MNGRPKSGNLILWYVLQERGCRYFMALGNHHDNMDLWDSKYQPWNSVNMGPKRDVVGEWAKACKKYGLPLGEYSCLPRLDLDGRFTRFRWQVDESRWEGKWWEG